jgi:hypothetical protein
VLYSFFRRESQLPAFFTERILAENIGTPPTHPCSIPSDALFELVKRTRPEGFVRENRTGQIELAIAAAAKFLARGI